MLSEFIKSLEAKIKSAEYREIKAPFFFNFKTEYSDGLICLNKGNYYHGKEQVRMQEGSFYFIPRGQRVNFGTGPMSGKDPQQEEVWSKERFDEDFTNTISAKGNPEEKPAVISFISFDTILYNAFPFFPLLDLSVFKFPWFPYDSFVALWSVCDVSVSA